MSGRWLGSSLLPLLCACRSVEPRSESLRIEIDSTGRYPIVRSAGRAPEWNASLLFTLGASGDSSVEFGAIRSVLLGRNGSLYLVDRSYRTLRVFDSAGRFERQLGREGSGPGEYRDPYSIAWLGDQLALLDPGNSRLGRYDSSGAWTGSWPVQRIGGGQAIRLYRTPPTVWAYATRPAEPSPEGVLVQYSASGPSDTLPLLPRAEGVTRGRLCERPDKGITFFAPAFGSTLLVIPTPAGTLAAARTGAYRIAFLTAGRDTLRLIERAVAPVPITDVEWEAANAEWRKFQEEWPAATCDQRDFDRPEYKPPIASLFFDDVGRLWVEATTLNGPRYDVFAPDGRLQRTVTGLPSSGGIDPSVAEKRIAIVATDSGEGPVVRVFRLP